MHYLPNKVQAIDKKLGDDTFPSPAGGVWDVFTSQKKPLGKEEVIDLFAAAAEKKKTQKLKSAVTKALGELESAGMLFKFEKKFLVVSNQL